MNKEREYVPGAERTKVLETALRFYADPKNWINTPPWEGDPEVFTPNAIPGRYQEGAFACDCGETARTALDFSPTLEVKMVSDAADYTAKLRSLGRELIDLLDDEQFLTEETCDCINLFDRLVGDDTNQIQGGPHEQE